eukprot:6192764-Pleurochrysis_carterae.AAC.1
MPVAREGSSAYKPTYRSCELQMWSLARDPRSPHLPANWPVAAVLPDRGATDDGVHARTRTRTHPRTPARLHVRAGPAATHCPPHPHRPNPAFVLVLPSLDRLHNNAPTSPD